MRSISYVKVKKKKNNPCHKQLLLLASVSLLWGILHGITVAMLVSQEYAALLVIFHKGLVFYQGFQTREN